MKIIASFAGKLELSLPVCDMVNKMLFEHVAPSFNDVQ